jgi:hypothetical protein
VLFDGVDFSETLTKWPHVQEELDQHSEERTKEVDSLKGQIEIVMTDLDVMAGRLKMVGSCEAAAASACRPGRRVHEGSGFMMMQSATLQPLLKKLRSAVVRSYVQGGARNMLNEMMNGSAAKLDNEAEKGGEYNRETLALLEEVRRDIASFNAQSTEPVCRFINIGWPHSRGVFTSLVRTRYYSR